MTKRPQKASAESSARTTARDSRQALDLPFSYNYAAQKLNRTRNHVRLVCLGLRKSDSLRASLEQLLREHEKGIGSN